MGNISPNSSIIIAIGRIIISLEIISELIKNTVANEVARIFDRFVPISITERYSGFLSKIDDASFVYRYSRAVHKINKLLFRTSKTNYQKVKAAVLSRYENT